MKGFEFTAVVWKEEGGYVSKCPELNVASCGASIKEAFENLREAVELYMENAKALGFIEDVQESLSTEEKYTALLEVST